MMHRFEKDWATIEAMRERGGSFVKALAYCFMHADVHNFAKLRSTFSEYWDEYEKIAKEKSHEI